MAEKDDSRRQTICDELSQAGISDAQVNLALDTNGTLLEQLSSYQLDEHHKRTVRDIFVQYAQAGDKT
ncbi:MAG: hypothetical protein CMM80_06465 [Rhodospirillaceae bacterium]|mgnify:CR=1 FL=1|nr:hypothetical protein [Rhodospirillaceae bacterium]|tara:strand:+ start:1005 stop:1208 length:204 start_codon:yes stop_codon:yes gene_type:complete